MTISFDNPLRWAGKRPGWVHLHGDEMETLVVMMKSLKHSEIVEFEATLCEGSEKQTFYKIQVDDLAMAYEMLRLARMLGW